MNIKHISIKKIYRQDNLNCQISESTIAVICYGHLRSFLYSLPKTLSSINQIGKVHLYMHTWDTIESDDNISSNTINLPNLIRSTCTDVELISLQIDSQKNNDFENYLSKSSPPAYMYYSMWQANLLKKEFENRMLQRYSKCIKIRPDIIIHKNIKNIERNQQQYFCSNNGDHFNIVAFTSSKTMDQICSYIGTIDAATSEEKINKEHKDYLIKTLGLKESPLIYGKDWAIIRSSFSILK